MKLLSQNWWNVTDKSLKGNWYNGKNGENFRCVWCGHKFILNEKYNMVYTNNIKCSSHIHGNPLICYNCYETHGEELIQILEERANQLFNNPKYWWFLTNWR